MEAESISDPRVCTTSLQLSRYWDGVSGAIHGNYYHEALIGHFKRDVHLRLIARWCEDLSGKIVLKTDLFEEAHGPDEFLFEIKAPDALLVGIDISLVTAVMAQRRAAARELSHRFVTCDVRALSLLSNSLDVVVSDSTLDHFPDVASIETSLAEIYRVLKPNGMLIVTLDNRYSISYGLSRLEQVMQLTPFYIGATCSMKQLTRILNGVGFSVAETTAIMHGLAHHTAPVMRLLKRLNRPGVSQALVRILAWLERLEAAGTKYLTGSFIAAKAVKV